MFDSYWYLSTYPDISAAGVDPRQHYLQHGRYEGRWPCELASVLLENELWSGGTDASPKQLNNLLLNDPVDPLNYAHAVWALARWHGSFGRWQEVLRYIQLFKTSSVGNELIPHAGPILLEFTALIETGRTEEARKWIDSITDNKPDLLLAASMVASPGQRLAPLNRLFRNAGLSPVLSRNPDLPPGLDNLQAGTVSRVLCGLRAFVPVFLQRPCVSIIIPACNAEHTLPTALGSLQQQTWRNLDIIVVDDASTDTTFAVALTFAQKDRRIRVFRHEYNQGAYIARNTGLAHARGEYITVHDSDDWSHPQKIEKQVDALKKDPSLKACLSHWVRCTSDLKFSHWRVETSWIYRNMSSLMFRRSVFDALGYWDRVNVGADTEYFLRIQRAYGEASIADVMPGIPLSFGRHNSASLSQAGATHLRTQFKGVRKDYRDATLKWHEGAGDIQALFLPERPSQRPFPAPAELIKPALEFDPARHVKLLDMIDPDWYRQTYPDVAAAGIDPVIHYLLHGGFEGRDPGPGFSSSGYRYSCPDPNLAGMNPLLHFIQIRQYEGYPALCELAGELSFHQDRKTILVCAHAAARQLFGAERSLLDILSALRQLEMNVIVAVPGIGNSDYMASLKRLAIRVICLPNPGWRQDRSILAETRACFERIIRNNSIDAVYVNTIVLWEPLLAAKVCGVPAVLHARELPEADPELCAALKADAQSIRRHVLDHADHIIANSEIVADYFSGRDNVSVVPNMVDPDAFDMPNVFEDGIVRVALIGSNTPRKGLHDFVKLARRLTDKAAPVKCILIGPENEHTARLRLKQIKGIEFAGYADTPQTALRQANIVVNLSHCQESFGRTVLEAMAARRPVIAYDRGALPELIQEGVNGYLIPFQDIEETVRKVLLFTETPDLLSGMGEAGRRLAAEQYGPDVFARKLEVAFAKFLKD